MNNKESDKSCHLTQKEGYLDFDEYIRQGEPDKKEKASIWQTAIGLQAVDGLKTSDYLKETARKHIIRLYIWSVSSVTCCWVNSGICETATSISVQRKSGVYNRILQPHQVPHQVPTQVRRGLRTRYILIMH